MPLLQSQTTQDHMMFLDYEDWSESSEIIPGKQSSTLPQFRPSEPSLLEKGPLRFVITDSPTDANVDMHAVELQKLNVKHVCRTTEPTYSTVPLTDSGTVVHEMSFTDGGPPPKAILQKWLNLVEQCFIPTAKTKKGRVLSRRSFSDEGVKMLREDERVSVHCVAGLGRAPVLVAVALIEFCGMRPVEAVKLIRSQRRGAINNNQMKWLENYKSTKHEALSGCGCVIA